MDDKKLLEKLAALDKQYAELRQMHIEAAALANNPAVSAKTRMDHMMRMMMASTDLGLTLILPAAAGIMATKGVADAAMFVSSIATDLLEGAQKASQESMASVALQQAAASSKRTVEANKPPAG